MDETYQTYVNRVAPMTLQATLEAQLKNIQHSPKFEQTKPVSFPGYTFMSPLAAEDTANADFYHSLPSCQQQLLDKVDPGLIIPLPLPTFHLTVADLIWNDAYHQALATNPDFESQLKQYISSSCQNYQKLVTNRHPIKLQLLGLTIFPRAIVGCLVPQNEEDYQKILELRRSIYQNQDIISLSIQQQYIFTAHITLAYFGDIAPNLDRARLAEIISSINEQWIDQPPQILTVAQALLYKFDDMIHYHRQPDWPMVEF